MEDCLFSFIVCASTAGAQLRQSGGIAVLGNSGRRYFEPREAPRPPFLRRSRAFAALRAARVVGAAVLRAPLPRRGGLSGGRPAASSGGGGREPRADAPAASSGRRMPAPGFRGGRAGGRARAAGRGGAGGGGGRRARGRGPRGGGRPRAGGASGAGVRLPPFSPAFPARRGCGLPVSWSGRERQC